MTLRENKTCRYLMFFKGKIFQKIPRILGILINFPLILRVDLHYSKIILFPIFINADRKNRLFLDGPFHLKHFGEDTSFFTCFGFRYYWRRSQLHESKTEFQIVPAKNPRKTLSTYV